MDSKNPVSQAASGLGFALCWLGLWLPICFLLLPAMLWFPNFTFVEDVWLSGGLALACAALLRSRKAMETQKAKKSAGALLLAMGAISILPCYWLWIVLHFLFGKSPDDFYSFWLPIEAVVFGTPPLLLGFGLKLLFSEKPSNSG